MTTEPTANPLREAVTAALRTTPATASADWPASSPHRTGPDTHDGHAYDARCALCSGDVAALTQAVLGVRDRETERLRGEVAELRTELAIQKGITADLRTESEARGRKLAALTATCDASAVLDLGFFSNPTTFGPCVLRRDHDGPGHKGANGAEWWPNPTTPLTTEDRP